MQVIHAMAAEHQRALGKPGSGARETAPVPPGTVRQMPPCCASSLMRRSSSTTMPVTASTMVAHWHRAALQAPARRPPHRAGLRPSRRVPEPGSWPLLRLHGRGGHRPWRCAVAPAGSWMSSPIARPRSSAGCRNGSLTSCAPPRPACSLLGRMRAIERVASFLLELHRRLQCDTGNHLQLPMCRLDIADHLGLTHETVSRALGELRQQGVLALPNPQLVVVLRPTNLHRLAGGG